MTQAGSLGWSESWACQPARPDRYLPARSGCVTVTRGDLLGGGREDLVVIYSRLAGRPFAFPAGSGQTAYQARQAMLEVVQPDGRAQTVPITGARAASLLSLARVNDSAGEELFLQTGGISSGSYGAIYDAYHGRVVRAGAFSYGGDSGLQARLSCLPGSPPKVVQLAVVPSGSLNGPWRGTRITYVWSRGRLVQAAKAAVAVSDPIRFGFTSGIGVGCLAGIGAYRTATGGTVTPATMPAPTPPPALQSTSGLERDAVLLDSFTSWRGVMYASGSALNATGPFSGCHTACYPTIWAYSATLKRWQLRFAGHLTPGGSNQLITFDGALLDFNTYPGTVLLRATNGRTFNLVALPARLAGSLIAEIYRARGSLVAVAIPGNGRGAGSAAPVWTSTNGTRWSPAAPVRTAR